MGKVKATYMTVSPLLDRWCIIFIVSSDNFMRRGSIGQEVVEVNLGISYLGFEGEISIE